MAKKRKYGSGTVRKRSDGRWEARVVIGYDESGNPKTKNVLAKTKAEYSGTVSVVSTHQFWFTSMGSVNFKPYVRSVSLHTRPLPS